MAQRVRLAPAEQTASLHKACTQQMRLAKVVMLPTGCAASPSYSKVRTSGPSSTRRAPAELEDKI